LFQRRLRNVSVGSGYNNNIEEESSKVIRAAVLGKDGVGKTGETEDVVKVVRIRDRDHKNCLQNGKTRRKIKRPQ